ncbi:MAG: TonB-dependent receptor [Pseudomonadales bacterium]
MLRKPVLLACACTLLMPLMVRPAQAAEGDRSMTIEEIVVTARRREETAQSVPIPVTALTGDQLQDRAAQDMTDLTRVTPNLSFDASSSNKNTAQVFLRGIGQVNWSPTQDPKIGIYQDGVYLGRPQGAVFDFMDVERVEVLRGPQGTLFGRNTTAGLVHVISKRPESEFDYRVGGGFGNDGQIKAEAMVNLPVNDTLAFRIAAQHRQSDGYMDNTGTGDDWNDENSQNARASLLWTPNDRFRALVIADYQRAREKGGLGTCEWTEPDNGAESQAFLPSIAFIFGVYDEIRDTCNATRFGKSSENDPSDSNIDAYGLNLTLNYDMDWAELTSITAYRDVEDLNQSWGWASDTVGTASFLEVLAYDEGKSDQWSQEFRLAGTAMNDSLDWVAGVYAFEENARNPLVVPIFRNVAAPDCADWPVFCLPSGIPGLPTLGDFAQLVQLTGSRNQVVDATNSSWAAFGEVTYHFNDAWSVTAGARYSEDERKFTRSQTLAIGILDPTLVCPDGSAPANGTTCKTDKSFDELTPRVIVSWQVNDDVMLYSGWSKGYSSGGFNQDVRMRPYEPEISKNWEVGMKSTWLDRSILVNLTAFHNTYENQQLTVGRLVDGQATADLINAQEAKLWGVEGEFSVLVAGGWFAQGSFGWIDGEYDKFTVQDNVIGGPPDFIESTITRDLSDSEMIRGAPYTYSVSIGNTQTLDRGGVITGQVGWAYRGRTYNTLETVRTSRQGKYGLLMRALCGSCRTGVPASRCGFEPARSRVLRRRPSIFPAVRAVPARSPNTGASRAASVSRSLTGWVADGTGEAAPGGWHMGSDDPAEQLARHFRDPYPSYEPIRAQRLTRDALGIWYAGRYEDVDFILKDRRFGKQPPAGTEHRLPAARRADQRDRRTILNADPPDHTRLRGLVAKAFSAHRVEAMRPAIQRLVDRIIDDVAGRGEMDLVREFAFPIPATVISDMLGIPTADRARFARLSNDIIAFGSGVHPDLDQETLQSRAREAAHRFDEYLAALFVVKRGAPADDLTTALIRAEDDEGRLTEEELTQNIRLLFMAGHETTVNLMCNAIVALFRFPETLARIRQQPTLMAQAVEEFLRFDSPVQQLPRIAQEDVPIGDQVIRAGEMVFCVLGAANRDPDVYANADRLDIERPFVRSKSFGGGIHFCLGAQLARIETEIALNTLLARLPDLALVEPDALSYPMNPIFRGPSRLLARWTP